MRELPKVGDKVYIPTFDDHGVIGGLAKVQNVIVESKSIILEIWPHAVFNWEVLEPLQNGLKKSFGQQKARLAQDFEEKQNQRKNSCRLR